MTYLPELLSRYLTLYYVSSQSLVSSQYMIVKANHFYSSGVSDTSPIYLIWPSRFTPSLPNKSDIQVRSEIYSALALYPFGIYKTEPIFPLGIVRSFDNTQPALVLAIARTIISVAPTSVNSSITVAIFFFSTMELTATQPSSSNALMVGARFPGVICVALGSLSLWTLY